VEYSAPVLCAIYMPDSTSAGSTDAISDGAGQVEVNKQQVEDDPNKQDKFPKPDDPMLDAYNDVLKKVICPE
jgi:hypothetical protein